jgi:hypothetical protein
MSYDRTRIAVLQKIGDVRKGKEFEDGPMELALDVSLREQKTRFPTHMDESSEARDWVIRRMGELITQQPEQLLREVLGNREYSQKVDSIATKGQHGEYVLKNPPKQKEAERPEAISQPGQSTRFNDLKYWKNGDPNSVNAQQARWGHNQMYRRRGE